MYARLLAGEGVTSPAELALIGSEQEVAEGILALSPSGVTEFLANDASATPDEHARLRALLRSLLDA